MFALESLESSVVAFGAVSRTFGLVVLGHQRPVVTETLW